MSAVQRKLVHKQFNSPMGLYSQDNVKATLNRELKAFGADGIEVDDSTSKPLNLANSAVLRAVEEEDQLNCEEKWQRPSRARHRPFPEQHPTTQTHQQLLQQIKTQYFSYQQNITVDRETVLKINRLATRRNLHKRDHSWPPSQCTPTGSSTATAQEVAAANLRSSPHDNVIHFDDRLFKRHNIDKIREKFNSPPTRDTRSKASSKIEPRYTAKSFPTSAIELVKDDKDRDDDSNTPTAKGFSAPETKAADIDIGIVAPKCEYYEQLAVLGSTRSNRSTPTSPGLKQSPVAQTWQKRQSQSLERVQRRKRGDDLPPPKPRSCSVTARINSVRQKLPRTLFQTALITPAKVDQHDEFGLMLSDKPQRKIGDSTNELLMSNDSALLHIEDLPLPPTPQLGEGIKSVAGVKHLRPDKKLDDSVTSKKQQQLLHENKKSGQQAHNIPVTLEQACDSKHAITSVQSVQDLNASAAQKIYDDACIYLRSIDLEDQTVAYIPAAITIVPTLTAEETDRQDEWWLEKNICSETQATEQLGSMYSSSRELLLTRQNTVDTFERSQDDEKEAISTATAAPKVKSVSESRNKENRLDIAQIEEKYANIQKSITEHLKQIDAYMENAKNALKHGVEEHQQQLKMFSSASTFSNEKPEQLWRTVSPSIETPLQTILRKISGASATVTDPEKAPTASQFTDVSPIENVAIVDEALKDLTHFADTIDKSVIESSSTESSERRKVNNEESLQPIDNKTSNAAPKDTKQLKLCVGFAHTSATANCSVCADCSETELHAKNTWGKVTPKDQYRSENMQNDHFDTYVATYEIPSPYISRQISWEDMFHSEIEKQRTPTNSNQHSNTLEIVHESDKDMSKNTKPRSMTTINATLTGSHEQIASSSTTTPNSSVGRTPYMSSKATTYVPQIEGHNIGLLVRTVSPQRNFDEPKITDGSSSASIEQRPKLLSENKRCSSQPPPFEFLMQHGTPSAAAVTVSGSHENIQSRHITPPPALGTLDKVDHSMPRHDHAVNRAFDNVSPRPYIAIEGYKRVAWPPTSEERIIREFTPQPHAQSPAPGYASHPSGDNQQHQLQQLPPNTAGPAQGPIYNNIHNQPSGYQNSPYQNPIQQPSQTAPRYQSQPQQQHHEQPYYQAPRQREQLPEQPIQYTQAQFNRPPQPHEPVAQGPQYTTVPQQSYQQNTYQREPSQSHDPKQYQQLGHQGLQDLEHSWKPIRGPTPKQGSQFYSHQGGQQNYPSYQNDHASQPQNYGTTQQQQQHQPQYNQDGTQQSYQSPNQQYQNQPNQYQNHSQQNPDPHYHQQQQPSQWNQQQQPQYQPGYPVQAPSQVNTSYAPQSNYQNNPQTQYQQQPKFGLSSQNYSVPQNQQQQPISQDQTDQLPPQALPQDYRGGSPGIITLRKETPVTQKPSPVYTSQPAATSYQGGNNLRGDLKWPPPEYKEAAVRENEERRKLALGPVCRPRRVNKDYTTFFAQHALNSTYPSYKVPPGTQHMLA